MFKQNNDMRDSAGASTASSNSGVVGLQRRQPGILAQRKRGADRDTGDDELDAAILSYARNLRPDVKWSVNLYWADWEGEDVGRADDNDGFSLTTALRMSF